MLYETKVKVTKPGKTRINFHVVHECQTYMICATLSTKRGKNCNLLLDIDKHLLYTNNKLFKLEEAIINKIDVKGM